MSLIEMSPDQIENFRAALVRLKDAGTRMLNPLIADIDRWNAIMSGDADAGDERPATMKGFADLLTEYLRTAPGHRVYIQSNDREWLAYYTNYVEYKREVRDRNHGFIPAHIEIHLTYWMLGNSYDEEVILYNEDVNMSFDGEVFHYKNSGEVFFFEDNRGEGHGHYLWEFESDDGSRVLSVDKWEGRPFHAYVSDVVPADNVAVYRR